jgi:hypothetical protein
VTDRWHTVRGTSFGGRPVAQYWVEFMLWEAILNDNPQIETIVELGTWEGGFSHFLAAQAGARNLGFRTYDAVVFNSQVPPGFVRCDIFGEADTVAEYLQGSGPTALFCDNGNKPRELRTFPQHLQEGSLVIVHDWETEVWPDDVPTYLIPAYVPLCEELGSMNRVFTL